MWIYLHRSKPKPRKQIFHIKAKSGSNQKSDRERPYCKLNEAQLVRYR